MAMPARWALAELLLWEGRLDEMRRLLSEIEQAGPPIDRIAALREHWRLDSVIVAREEVGPVLDHAERNAPDDPYVWLARATSPPSTGSTKRQPGGWIGSMPYTSRMPRSLGSCPAPACDGRWPPAVRTRRGGAGRDPARPARAGESWSIRAWFAALAATPRRSAMRWSTSSPSSPATPGRRSPGGAGDARRPGRPRRGDPPPSGGGPARQGSLPPSVDRGSRSEFYPRAAGARRLAERLGRRFEAEGWLRLILTGDPEARRRSTDCGLARTRHRPSCPSTSCPIAGPARSEIDRILVPPALPSATTPRRPASGSPTTTARRRSTRCPRPSAAAWPARLRRRRLARRLRRPGRRLPARDRPGRRTAGDRLFRNRGDGTFEDATDGLGHRPDRPADTASASTVGDYDNDGHPDLFVTRWRSYALYRNRGDGTFEDVTEPPGWAATADWPTSAAFADLDSDGDLDLYVCHYLAWDAEHPTLCRDPPGGRPDRLRLLHAAGFPARPDHLFRNDGGRFVDVDGRGRDRRPRRPRPGRRRGRPRRRRPHRPVRRQRHDGQLPLPQPRRPEVRGDRPSRRAWPATPTAATRRGWAWPAATSTATAGPTWPSPTSIGESTTFYQNLGERMFADATAAVGLDGAEPVPAGLRHRLPRRQQRRPARPGRRPTATSIDLRPNCPVRDAGPAPPRRPRRPPGRRLRAGRASLDRPPARPRPGRRRPRQRRPPRPADRRPEQPLAYPPQPDRPAGHFAHPPAGGHDLEPRRRRRQGRRSRPAADGRRPGGPAAAATPRRATLGSTSDWDRYERRRRRDPMALGPSPSTSAIWPPIERPARQGDPDPRPDRPGPTRPPIGKPHP